MPQIMKFDSGSSTGWRTEAVLALLIALGLALLGDIAGHYELPKLAEVALGISTIAGQVLAVATARARQAKVDGK